MRQANLILHCGGAHVDREQLALVKTPEATDTWTPIAHSAFIDQVESALTAQKMTIVSQAHALAREGGEYFGLLQVANCKSTGDEYAYVIGTRNSHTRRFTCGLAVGAQVFICDNLGFSSEITVARKHTTHILRDLPILTTRAIGMLSEKWTSMSDRFEKYKTTEISDRDAHDFMIRAVEQGVCPLRQLDTVMTEWRTPRHPEFAQAKNAWRLYMAHTEAAKEGSLAVLPNRTIALHGMLDAQVGYAAAAGMTADLVDAEVTLQN